MKIKFLLINLFTFFNSMEKEEESSYSSNVLQIKEDNNNQLSIKIWLEQLVINIQHQKTMIKLDLIEINEETQNNIKGFIKKILDFNLE